MANVKYTKDILLAPVRDSFSYAEVLRRLGKKENGSMHKTIKMAIIRNGIDTSHFRKHTVFLRPGCNKRTPDKVLVLKAGGRRERAYVLRRALIEIGREYKCVHCGIGDEWNGRQITLEVSHKNHNWLDNRQENLEFACPNCHSQYPGPSYKGKTLRTTVLW